MKGSDVVSASELIASISSDVGALVSRDRDNRKLLEEMDRRLKAMQQVIDYLLRATPEENANTSKLYPITQWLEGQFVELKEAQHNAATESEVTPQQLSPIADLELKAQISELREMMLESSSNPSSKNTTLLILIFAVALFNFGGIFLRIW